MDAICGTCQCKVDDQRNKTTSCSPNLELKNANSSCTISMKERKEETTSEESSKEKELPRDNINSSKEKEIAREGKFKAFIQKLFNSKECRELFENDICDNVTCLSQKSSACLTEGNPRKKGDPRALLIPCSIQNMEPRNTLADLGDYINVMSSNLFEKLILPRLKSTRLTLRLADGNTRYPEGLAEDVLVRIGNFLLPVDFFVCKMGDDDPHESLILGRPFLATCRARIDVSSGEITLRFEGQATNDDMAKAKEGADDDERAKVKSKVKPKPKRRNDKLTWKNTWVPKCFLPTTKEFG